MQAGSVITNENLTSKRKALFGLFTLIIILGVSLFIPAGTLDYWQAWVYIFLFGGSSLLITLFLMKKDMELLKRRLKAGAREEKERNQKIIQAFAQVAFLSLMVCPGFDHRYSWSNIPFWLAVTGEIFVVFGFYIVFLVFKENSYTSALIEIAEGQKVILTGPYAVVRHPMYSGALLLLLFTPLALASYWDLIFSALISIIIIWRLLDEEKFLSKNLPGYKTYCLKTRFRIIPKIW